MSYQPKISCLMLGALVMFGTACGSTDGTGVSQNNITDENVSDSDIGNNASFGEEGGAAPGSTGEATGIQQQPGQLTAGRWLDHENWLFWSKLMDPGHPDKWRDVVMRWGMQPFERIAVHVVSGGLPVTDQIVSLHDGESQVLWDARTDNRGNAYLFPTFYQTTTTPLALEVAVGGVTRTLLDDEVELEIELDQAATAPPALDVLFAIDVTGSMLDEQEYLRAEMKDVMQRLETQRAELDIRVSFNFYCDPDDEFVVKSNPFTDVQSALDVLEVGAACGGGDTPEAVDEGLADALNHDWRESARARLLFLVLDAGPHRDEAGLARLENFASQAASQGIKLVPIVSSGAAPDLEFLLRSLVIATNGTYTFLTADSGIGGEKLEPTIGEHQVELLNELMLDLLLSETATN